MNKIKMIINEPKNISFKDIIQISSKIPDNIAWLDILKEYARNQLYKNLNNKPIYSYIKKWNKIVSFGKIVSKDNTYEDMLNKLWINIWNYVIWTTLFTVKKEKWKWYAKILKQEQIKYIKENNSKIKKLVWATINKWLLNLYKSYWARYIWKYHIFNTSIYFYYYDI